MPWYWVVLTAIVRVLFVLAPFMGVRKEFPIPNNIIREVQDFARAGACKAMLLSFPALQIINLLATTETVCGKTGVAPFPLAVILLLCAVLAVALYFLPTWLYRGKLKSFLWFAGITTFDALLTMLVFPRFAGSLCQH